MVSWRISSPVAAVVVFLDEAVELGLQLGDGADSGRAVERDFAGLVEGLHLARTCARRTARQ
jgi:hypothetical protein